ncbi:MAG: nicotinate (nicotinamide) nucleotide adenylyltransferase [Chthoniobacterales bacterium]|nr:MAG: nicotinate (nicotinamide) nucleotide adenylyltransferase [Chthoniobacterales bacterium]
MTLEKIGVYGGTFDPVHHAHLILAREAAEQHGLDKVIFIPAATSPFKAPPFANASARLQMLRAGIGDEPRFEIDECELQRPPPSYTVDTIKEFRQKYSGAQLFLLIGDDNLAGLPQWRDFSQLREMVIFIVLPRAKTGVRHDYLAVKRRVDISATEIRDRVSSGRSIYYFVPGTVEEIITAQHLYKEVTR